MSWRWFPEGPDGIVAHLRRATLEETDDSGTQQILKKLRGLKSERPEDIYRPQPHGFSSHAPAGSEGLFLALGGRSDRLVALGFEHKDHRPKNLPIGGAALYDAHGKIIKLIEAEIFIDAGGKPVRIINATTIFAEASEKITLKAPTIVLDGNCYLGGEDADRPASAQGTIDTGLNADIENPATKVWMK